IPHLRLDGSPAISAICVAVKPQNENVCASLLLCAPRLRCPDFWLGVFKWKRFPTRAARIDRRPCRKKNQTILQMTKDHYRKVREEKDDQPPTRWNNSCPQILYNRIRSIFRGPNPIVPAVRLPTWRGKPERAS